MHSGGARTRAGAALGALLATGVLVAVGMGQPGSGDSRGGAGSATSRVTMLPEPSASASASSSASGSGSVGHRGARPGGSGGSAAAGEGESSPGSSSNASDSLRILEPEQRGDTGSAGPFLPQGACVQRASGGTYRQVECSSGDAWGTVIQRFPAGTSAPVPCPENTDYELDLTTVWSGGSSASTREPAGTACVRTVQPPHPSDPGNGGGVGVVTGDCLYASGGVLGGVLSGLLGSAVRETACAPGASPAAQYRVIAITALPGTSCPTATQYLITIQNPGEPRKTACAVRV